MWIGSFGCKFFKWINVCRGNGLLGEVSYLGTLGNKDWQLVPRSVLKDFSDDAFPTSVSNLFLNGTTRMLKPYWRWRVQHSVGETNGRGRVAVGVLDR